MPRGDGHFSGSGVAAGFTRPTRGSVVPRRGEGRTQTGRLLTPSYLALLRAGFAVRVLLPERRCALAAPFHLCRQLLRAAWPCVFCGTFRRPDRSGRPRCYRGALPSGVRTFLCRSEGRAQRLEGPQRPPDSLDPDVNVPQSQESVNRRGAFFVAAWRIWRANVELFVIVP